MQLLIVSLAIWAHAEESPDGARCLLETHCIPSASSAFTDL